MTDQRMNVNAGVAFGRRSVSPLATMALLIAVALTASTLASAFSAGAGSLTRTRKNLPSQWIQARAKRPSSFAPCGLGLGDRKAALGCQVSQRPRKSSSLSMGLSGGLPPYPVRVAVLGGGNFGLALASALGRKGIPVTLLVRTEDVAEKINADHRHPRYMPDLDLPKSIRATSDPETALGDATYVVHAVPCQYSREFLNSVKEHIPAGVPVLSASKGIETASYGFMADIFRECLGEERSFAFLSGPSFAREICEGVVTAVVIASEDEELADDLADLFSSEIFRVFTTTDVIGVEIGGAVKNVIAIAAGMCEGLGLGTNAMSGLVTRGCGEMRRLGNTLGARPSTISGLSGVGDTFGTCFGPLSRNRKFGYRLGKGETMDEILASTTEVAEGVDTAIALKAMILNQCKGYRLDLKYPILFGVADILEGKQTPIEGLKGLMTMPMRKEAFERYY